MSSEVVLTTSMRLLSPRGASKRNGDVPLAASSDTAHLRLCEDNGREAVTTTPSRVEPGAFESLPKQADVVCDACPFCLDVCDNLMCATCAPKRHALGDRRHRFTKCEVRRHSTAQSCWLVAGSDVYDVTSFLPRHPAGTFSIVRHAGGQDCAEDLSFHSSRAQKLWAQHKIGRLVRCKSDKDRAEGGCLLM